MSIALPAGTLDVHRVALEAAGQSIALVRRVPAPRPESATGIRDRDRVR